MHAIFAERVCVDQYTNELHLFAVVSAMTSPQPSLQLLTKAREEKKTIAGKGRLSLLVLWRRNNIDKPEPNRSMRVDLIAPGNKKIGTSIQQLKLRDNNYVRSIFRIDTLPIEKEGLYTARISILSGKKWTRVGETSIDLGFAAPQVAGAKVRIH